MFYIPEYDTPINWNVPPQSIPTFQFLERLEEIIKSIWPENEPIIGIGVAAPGPLDPYEGVVHATPNIPEWVDLPLGLEVEV